MDKIGKVLDSVLTKRNFYIKIRGNLALFKWDKIVGEKLAKFTTPLYYKEGVLYVGVVSSLFMRELTLMKDVILEKVQKEVGKSPVHDLKFRVIEKPVKRKVNYVPETKEEDFSEIKLTPSDLEWVENLVKKLKADENAKKKYAELLILYKKNEKLREKLGYKRCKKCGVLFKGKGDLCPVCKATDKRS
jgi:rubrerythrin